MKTCEHCGQTININERLYYEFLKSDRGKQHLRRADKILIVFSFTVAVILVGIFCGIMFISDDKARYYFSISLPYVCLTGSAIMIALLLVTLRKRDKAFEEFKAKRQN